MNSDVSIEVFRNNFFVSLKEILSKDADEKSWEDVLSHAEDEIVTEELYKKRKSCMLRMHRCSIF